MKMKHALIGVAAILTFAAANLKAQTVVFAEAGSSAIYEELGQASANTAGCVWTGAKGTIFVEDTRVSGNPTENGTSWITWTIGNGTSCSSPGTTSTINVGLNIDSVIGNRCFFAKPRCTFGVTGTPTSGQNALPGFTDTNLPTSIAAAVAGASVNTAATDIRPEDAKFASLRMFTPCGTAINSGGNPTQYLGLGYQTGVAGVGTAVQQEALPGGVAATHFNVFDFNLMGTDPINGSALPGTYAVTAVGAVPIVVFVNPQNEAGFGSLLVQNIDRATLAGYLDGTYGRTADLITQVPGASGGATVYMREPLSGTYNTMEYAIPNSLELQTSQDLGLAAVAANGGTSGTVVPPAYCNGATWSSSQNPLVETYSSLGRSGVTSGGRIRAIGTGNQVKAVLNTSDSLGYSFWSAANFANATASNAKYLTVDGIDPIQQNWVDGLVPTSGNELLGNVTMAHVKDGSYPIFAIERIVSDPSGPGYNATVALAASAVKFLSPTQPDFVHITQLAIVRSHFAPPGVTFPCASPGTASTPSNGGAGTGSTPECGGDVGGLVYSLQADSDYILDSGAAGGNTGRRQ